MTLAEIETLLGQLQNQINANTAAIAALTNSLTQYATTDDVNSLSTQVNTLLHDNYTLQESVAALGESVKKIDNLSKLTDVEINGIVDNDVLQYSVSTGKWHNIQPNNIKGLSVGSSTTSITSLTNLSDVMLTDLTNGQGLVYDATLGYWTNKNVESSNGSIGNLDNYMTFDDAKRLYLPLIGGTLTGPLVIKAMLTVEDNALVHKTLTMYDN